MKYSLTSGFLPTAVIFCAFFTFTGVVYAGSYSGGTGTAEDPYRISTVADWQELIAASDDWNKQFILLNDIDFGGINLTPVAPDNDPTDFLFGGVPFTGIFEGNGSVFRNVVINQSDKDWVGLFGYVESDGQIRNLGLIDSDIQGHYFVGGLAGMNSGTITGCYATGSVTGESFLGGLCGNNYGGTITGCYAMGTTTGRNRLGGLCGENYSGTISKCYAMGTVTSEENSYGLGGLCGENGKDGTINSCYASGAVTGGYNSAGLGGLCGGNGKDGTINSCYATCTVTGGNNSRSLGGLCGGNNSGIISECYATGTIIGGNYSNSLGGLCGGNYSGTISKCYATGTVIGWDGSFSFGGLCGGNSDTISGCFWNKETSGQSRGIGGGSSAGVTGLTTAEMKTRATFTNTGWDFVNESVNGTADVWRMCGDGISYPRLSWEFAGSGDMICPNGVGLEDLLYLAGRWMASNPATFGAADVDGNGKVDLGDFGVMAENWGR